MQPYPFVPVEVLMLALAVQSAPVSDVRAGAASDGPLLVEPIVDTPADMLECLMRHRYTPLVCQLQMEAARRAPDRRIDDGCAGCVTGVCVYDSVRGHYCACQSEADRIRGHPLPPVNTAAAAPDCIPDR